MPSPAASDDDPSEKQRLRAHLRQVRRVRSDAQRTADADRLARVVTTSPVLRGAAVVAAYASTPTEPGTGPLRTAMAGSGVRVLLPVVTPSGVLAWRWYAPPGAGAPTSAPHPAPGLHLADVVLLPALAVDADGHRLGQGGGHYDRTLAALLADPRHRRPPLVALVHDDEVLAAGAVPAEAHDVRVDAAATPRRWVALG